MSKSTPQYNYNNPGRCRKCDHRLVREGQAGAVPPRTYCPVCSRTDWSKVYFLTVRQAV